MGSKSSSSQSSNVTNQYDQRAITTVDDRDTAYTQNTTDSRNQSVNVSDSSSRSYVSDSSNRSSTTTTINTSDPGAVRLGELNAQFLGAAAETQTDAVKALAQFGTTSLRDLGESVSNVYEQAGKNSATAWTATLNKSGELIDKLVTAAGRNTEAAQAVAQSAIGSYQPAENKNADALKWAAIAAAVVAGLVIFKKA